MSDTAQIHRRPPRALIAWLVLAVAIAVLVAVTVGLIYVVAWLVVVAIVTGAILVAGAAGRHKGRDASRSSDGPLPAQGIDHETPLGDTDQHASEQTARGEN